MNIAFFSDNYSMLQSCIRILEQKNLKIKPTYFCSRFSNPIDFVDIPIKQIDIKLEYQNLIKEFDIIFSIHSKQIFPKELVEQVRCINLHPGYNPINRGWYPQVFSILYGLETGATIHEMDAELDHGPIIARKKVTQYSWDTSLTLYSKIVEAELELFEETIESIINKTYSTITIQEEGNIFLKKDFNSLLEIDMQEIATFEVVINKLRSLTHGKFKNAYFVDKETNRKVFVNIALEPEHE